jgi:N utilization substance protein B
MNDFDRAPASSAPSEGRSEARRDDHRPGKRRMAREMAVQMLYQHDLGGATVEQIFRVFDRTEYFQAEPEEGEPEPPPLGREEGERRRRDIEEAFHYARELVTGTVEGLDEVDGLIRKQADNWRLERMPAVDRNILRLAVYELLHEDDIPKLVVVDEAIELAKKFSTEQSSRFVNGLLDGLLKQHEFPGTIT